MPTCAPLRLWANVPADDWRHVSPDRVYQLAMQVMKITLSMILTRFRLILVPGARIDRTVKITMSPRYGMPMSIHKQDRRFQAMPVTGNIRQMVDLGQ